MNDKKSASLFLVAAGLLTLLTACSNSDSGDSKKGPAPQGLACSLEGSWNRCDTDGVSSQKVALSFTSGNLVETIESFNSNATCAGAADGQFAFNATVVVGIIGHSSSAAGGTDVDLVPDVDFAGCGVGAPVYTMLKFNDDCSEFQSANVIPACADTGRGTGFDAAAFVRPP